MLAPLEIGHLVVLLVMAIVASTSQVLTGDYFSQSRPWPRWIAPPRHPFKAWLWWIIWFWAGFLIVYVAVLAIVPRLYS